MARSTTDEQTLMSEPATTRLSLDPTAAAAGAAALREANLAFARRYPGESAAPQPVQTLIEGAQHFVADVVARRGALALDALDRYAPDPAALGRALGITGHPDIETIAGRVREKLAREPVEDYRIDFEDGYGVHANAEEDERAVVVAREIARGIRDRSLPAALGVRIKPLTEELRARSVRTLDILLTALVDAGGLPSGWTITVPKITVIEQVDYITLVLRALERSLGLAERTLTFEIMIEVPQAIADATGRTLLPRLIEASDGRLRAIDFGTYDYTAGCGITAAHQRLRHPACEFAKQVIQVSFAGTGVRVADGSTAMLPVPRHPESSSLTSGQRAENEAAVHAGWALHFADVRHSLAGGFYQGWDLHAAQLVSRYAAIASFYLEGQKLAGARLHSFLNKAAAATLAGGVLDEPATGQGLLGYFVRGMNAGVITESEASTLTGLSAAELRQGSILSILRSRGAVVDQAGAQ
jgi:citrate lyase beta subunit